MKATVLESIVGNLTKEFIFSNGVITKKDYDPTKNFKFNSFEFNFDTIEELYNSLLLFTKEPKLCVIRGVAKSQVNTNVRRLGETNGDKAVFFDVPQEWVSFDVDDIEIPAQLTLDEIGEYLMLTELATLLPEAANTDYIFQHSSSAGVFKSDNTEMQIVSGHFWFLCDPVTCVEMRRWGEYAGWKDPSLFKSVQPHYIATPIFTNMPDPIGAKRYVLRKGENRKLHIEIPTIQQITMALPTKGHGGGSWINYIDQINPSCAHEHILRGAGAYWTIHGIHCDWGAFTYEVLNRMQKCGHPRGHKIDDVIKEITDIRKAAERQFKSMNIPQPPKYKNKDEVKRVLDKLKRVNNG